MTSDYQTTFNFINGILEIILKIACIVVVALCYHLNPPAQEKFLLTSCLMLLTVGDTGPNVLMTSFV